MLWHAFFMFLGLRLVGFSPHRSFLHGGFHCLSCKNIRKILLLLPLRLLLLLTESTRVLVLTSDWASAVLLQGGRYHQSARVVFAVRLLVLLDSRRRSTGDRTLVLPVGALARRGEPPSHSHVYPQSYKTTYDCGGLPVQ
jgi:hypothetical protein